MTSIHHEIPAVKIQNCLLIIVIIIKQHEQVNI